MLIGGKPIFVHTSIIVGKEEEEREGSGRGTSSHPSHNCASIFTGQQTGYIAGAFYVGNFIGSLVWGWISDVWGRRPVLILNTCGIAFSVLLFGLSQNAAWAIASRFLWGLLDGTLGVCKTCIAEVGSVFLLL